MVKMGDTLIEVTLAVGIFSMIAIAVVSVLSSSTSGAQTALESTLTREEIDAQAEALRFIQDSAVNGDSRYKKLWDAIVENVYTLKNNNRDNAVLQPTFETCDALYSGDEGNDYYIVPQNAFIINTKALGEFSTKDFDSNEDELIKSVFVSSVEKDVTGSIGLNEKFSEASTYPHLIFTNPTSGINSDSGALADDSSNNTVLDKAEGIYIVAVPDSGTTQIGDNNSKQSAFYDFYIRTCWYGSNDQTPSTISTIIRLYDPDVLK